MKKLKIIVSILLFVLVVVLSGELYQQYLGNFTNQFYYYSVSNDGDRKDLLTQIIQSCQENDIDVFACKSSILSQKKNTLTLYATTSMRERLIEKYNISEGQHSSLFSGATNILIEDFMQCLDDNIDCFYFDGPMENVLAAKSLVAENFGTSYVHSESEVGNEWLGYVIWVVVFAVILLLTWFDIEFSKKEMFVRFSMGANRHIAVLKNILSDSLTLTTLFFLIRTIYESRFNVCYSKTIITLMFTIFLFLNAALHCTLLSINYKQIIYGANINTGMLSNCYILKALSLIVAILSLSINMQFVSSNYRYMRMYNDIDQYTDYSFISLEIDTSKAESISEKVKLNDAVTNQVLHELYFQDKVALASYSASDNNDNPFIIINKNTQGAEWVKDLIKDEEKADIYVIVPSRMNQNEIIETAIGTTKKLFGDYSQNANYKTIIYKSSEKILFFESNNSIMHPYGFDMEEQPFLIYMNFTYEETYSFTEKNLPNATQMWSDIMFNISEKDIDILTEKYNEITNITRLSVSDRCNEYRSMFIRIITLNSIISIFMILLELVIVTTIIKMEYMINSKEYAVKKLLGYSTFKKVKALFLLNLFSAGIGLFAAVGLSLMFDITQWYFNLISTVLFACIEFSLMICYSERMERISVQRVLKGGLS